MDTYRPLYPYFNNIKLDGYRLNFYLTFCCSLAELYSEFEQTICNSYDKNIDEDYRSFLESMDIKLPPKILEKQINFLSLAYKLETFIYDKSVKSKFDTAEDIMKNYQDIVYNITRYLVPVNKNYINYVKNGDYEMLLDTNNNVDINKNVNDLVELKKSIKIEQKVSELHQCQKCKRSKCYVKEVQVRSADEAKDTFITCAECTFSWKIKG